MKETLSVVLVPHTHWDRAWYVPFQHFRARLVRLVDRLIRLLEDCPEYPTFMLDGQMVVLEDYLEVRPQNAARLKQLAREGRVQVGPWYVLMDEFLVSPESLIRNLMLGLRMAEEYGGAMKEGYVPDGFGHIAQLPQILRGFGIGSAVFWRGMGDEGERLGSEFIWEAPDGSDVLAIWLPHGYHNASNLGYAIHWGDTSQMEFDMELAQAKIDQALAETEPFARTRARLLMNGIDHQEPQPQLPEIITLANERLAGKAMIRQGSLSDHVTQVRSLALGRLERFQGEFRWGRYSEILQGVYATRLYLKQANHRVETLLERYAEPLAAAAWLMEGNPDQDAWPDLLWTAWRWLLKNHPHDDIYGSSIDQVHEEMDFRFSQAKQIGQIIVRDGLRAIARQVDFSAQPGTPLLVYNPLNWQRQEMVVGDIDFDFDDPKADDFHLVDSSGRPVPVQVLGAEDRFWLEVLKPNRKRRVHVAFPAEVPPCGYRAYYAVSGSVNATSAQTPFLQLLEWGAENDFLCFTIEPDGALTVRDKLSGGIYPRLHVFTDVEDAGDEYSYSPAVESETITSEGVEATVERIVTGRCQISYRVQIPLSIPAGLTEDRRRRSSESVPLLITSTITLYAGQPGIYIVTELDNQAKDHKLSVRFPTELTSKQVHVDGHFLVVARDVDLPPAEGWIEDPTPLMHQRAFVDISDGERGLALLNRGLAAVEVAREEPDGEVTLALTLLRSIGWLSRGDLLTRRNTAGPVVETPGAQCLGPHRYEYAILPHAGDWHQVYQHAYAFNAPLHLARADIHEGLDLREMNITGDDPSLVKPIPWPRTGRYPDTLSWITLEPATLVLSALKRSERHSGLIVRGYNMDDAPATARLTFFRPLARAYRMDLNERWMESLPVRSDGSVTFPVRGHEIFTVEFVPAAD
ncbi:MAG TPA: hypothetical protein EYP04_05250 [Anaerolineae bacterium]|nr:hypothetical protein [Anaerolineae bacterium]HIQ05250.1 hypothetical protein [Anaerolineae bacterium]